jgi:hypothetical protein
MAERIQLIVQSIALAHDPLRARLIVPEIRIFGLLVQFGEAPLRGIDVKDASSAARRTA